MAKAKKANGDGTLRQRKPGQWEFRVVIGYGLDGKAIRKSFYGANGTAAKKAYKEWLKNSGKPQIEKVTTVGEWALKWLDLYVKGHVSDGHYMNQKGYVNNHIIPALGHLRFDQVKPAHIVEFFNLRSQMSRSARNTILVALRGIFDTAIDNGCAVSNPTAKYKLEKDNPKEPKVWSESEIHRLFPVLPEVEDGEIVELVLLTGLRRGELAAWQKSDINRDAKIITIQRSLSRSKDGGYKLKTTKSGKERILGINDQLASVLDRITHNGLYVIKGTSPMLPVSVNTLTKRYTAALKRANAYLIENGQEPVPELSIHKCRHTYATYLVKGGAHLSHVQKLLGHSTVRVTEIYAHVDTDDLLGAVKKLAY